MNFDLRKKIPFHWGDPHPLLGGLGDGGEGEGGLGEGGDGVPEHDPYSEQN